MLNFLPINYEEINSATYKRPKQGWEWWLINFGWITVELCDSTKTWYMIQSTDFFDLVWVDIWEWESSLSDWWWVYYRKFGNSTRTAKFFIQAGSYAELINMIDELKAMYDIEMELSVKITDAEYRTTRVTLKQIKIPKFTRNQTFVEDVQVSFLFTTWYWYNDQVTLNSYNISATWTSFIIWNSGKYDTFPIMRINWDCNDEQVQITITSQRNNTTTAIQTAKVTLVNNRNNLLLDYTPWETASNKTVRKDWSVINYSWYMWPLTPWSNIISIKWVTWVVDILYNKTFL